MDWKKAHFIGIGGVGMSATAKLLKDAGVAVSGSDEEVYPPVSDFLQREGLPYQTPYAAKNIPADADLIVIGKNAKLVPETNAEVAAAYQSGKQIASFPEVLATLSADKETIVVAGSFGKSTSTALMAHCLQTARLDLSYFIGAIPVEGKNAALGAGKLFILEGDEYPSSNSDPRAKFLHYHPTHLLITPLAHDHFNVFATPEAYMRPFIELAALVTGTLVVCAESPMSKTFISLLQRPIITYGAREGDFHAKNIAWNEATSFDLYQGEALLTHVETTQLGEHTIQNIVGVAALLFSLKLTKPEQFAAAVASFKGIVRRLDKKSERTSIPIYEGFGSSYEKLRSAIEAMKLHFSDRRLIIVFEPHTFSWRNRESLVWYDTVFKGAAKVYIFNPPHDGKDTQLSTEEIAERVNGSGTPAVAVETPEQTLASLEKELQPNDVMLLSSSGAMGGLIELIPKMAEQKFPKQ